LVAYLCLAHLDGRDLYFLWHTDVEGDTPDQVLKDVDGHILAFASETAARSHAPGDVLRLEDDAPVAYDLDRIAEWCERPWSSPVDCEELLDAWNLFMDLGAAPSPTFSLFRASQAESHELYEKLFFGSNLPAVTPEGEHYRPSWLGDELMRLSSIVGLGLQVFRSLLGPAADQSVAADGAPGS
jgi:hypothetical protein